MNGICPAIKLVGETSVSASLKAMDCQIEQAVGTGYERLFGTGGAFGAVLTTLLAIYVALLAIGLMTGRTRLTLTMMSPRLMTMVLVLTFVTMWPAYHTLFYGLFMGGPDEIASALLGQKGSAVMNFAETLDKLFVRFAHIANALEGMASTPPAGAPPAPAGVTAVATSKPMPVTLFWLSGLMLLLSTLGVLILTRMVLYILLIIGPVFIVMALFSQTRGLFNGWLRTAVIFALMPLLTVLGGSAALGLFGPLLDAIAADPQAAVTQVQPMVILFMGSTIYAAFLLVLMWVAASLVQDWQAALRDKPAPGFERADALDAITLNNAAVAAASSAAAASRTDSRIEALTQAVSRPQTNAVDYRTDAAGTAMASSAAARRDRVEGLGQSFRAAKPAISTDKSGLAAGPGQ